MSAVEVCLSNVLKTFCLLTLSRYFGRCLRMTRSLAHGDLRWLDYHTIPCKKKKENSIIANEKKEILMLRLRRTSFRLVSRDSWQQQNNPPLLSITSPSWMSTSSQSSGENMVRREKCGTHTHTHTHSHTHTLYMSMYAFTYTHTNTHTHTHTHTHTQTHTHIHTQPHNHKNQPLTGGNRSNQRNQDQLEGGSSTDQWAWQRQTAGAGYTPSPTRKQLTCWHIQDSSLDSNPSECRRDCCEPPATPTPLLLLSAVTRNINRLLTNSSRHSLHKIQLQVNQDDRQVDTEGWVSLSGPCAHQAMVSKIQWKPFWPANPALSTEWLDWMAISCELWFIFALRKKGSWTKERMKEEEIEKSDCGPPTRKVFFWDFVGLEPSGT